MARRKKTTSRRASKFGDEVHIGRETLDWKLISEEDYPNKIMESLRHYGYFYERKSYVSWATEWIKKNSPEDLKAYKASEDWRTSPTLASLMKMELMGADLDASAKDFIKDNLETIVSFGQINIDNNVDQDDDDDEPVKRKSPAELLKEKTNKIIGDIEGFIDDYFDDSLDKKFSLYTHLKGIDAAGQTTHDIIAHYKAIREELRELIEEKTEDLVEAYGHLSVPKQKKFFKLIESFIEDSEKYLLSKKATRKPRAKKATPASKQAEKVIYQKECAEYKISSTSPAYIVGASEVYLFNTKTRVIKYLVASSRDGFIIKGTTVKNYDADLSFKKTLRKPEEMIKSINKSTKLRALKALKALKTKQNATDGRINADTIILKINQ